MTGPSDESLRRAGLAWYAEDYANVPAHCAMRRTVGGGVVFSPLSRECALAITGKKPGDTFTQEDYDAIREYLRQTMIKQGVSPMTDKRWLDKIIELSGIMGKPFSTLEQSSKIWPIDRPIDDAVETAREAGETIGDIADFVTNPMTFVAVGALVIGLGMVGLGGMRLLR